MPRLAVLTLALVACARPVALDAAPVAPPPAPEAPRNVILVIGDGMGPQQVGLLHTWASLAPNTAPGGPTAFERLADAGYVGLSSHWPGEGIVTDSACSATQLALGLPAVSEGIGVDVRGAPQPTVLQVAQQRGKATGLVSDTRLTHATPASFAAVAPHRSMENDIAADMIATGPQVMLSGGFRHFLAADTDGSRRDDDRDLFQEARDAGYEVVTDRQGLLDAEGDRLLGLFAPSGMQDAISDFASRQEPDRVQPSLAEMTDAALTRLSKDPEGFFLMVECGQIDWAGHANDAGWMLAEMRRCDETLTVLEGFLEGRDDTLLVITADHETGGFGFSYSAWEVPEPRDLPGPAFEGVQYAPNYNFGQREDLDTLAGQSDTVANVLRGFAALPEAQRTPALLAERLTEVTGFPISEDEAAHILEDRPTPARSDAEAPEGTMPPIHDFPSFYPYGEGHRTAVVARVLARRQGVVWSTGTHTHTPVPVIAVGPGSDTFGRIQHHTDIGRALHRFVGGDTPVLASGE
jgi:alkaline phosphatase